MSKQENVVRRRYVKGLHGQMHLWLTEPDNPSARPLICFHASPLSGRSYEHFLKHIGEDRLAIAPDTPGYGMSDAPDRPIDISGYAAAMAHLIDLLAITEIDLMGYATGSFIAAELARQKPNLVRRILLASAPILDASDSQHLQDLFGHEIAPQADGSHLPHLWDQVFDGRGPAQTLEWLMYIFPDHIRAGPRKPWAPLAAFKCDLKEILRQLDHPILVINFMSQVYDTTAKCGPYLNNGQLLDMPHWGHGFLQGHPSEAAAIARNFLDT